MTESNLIAAVHAWRTNAHGASYQGCLLISAQSLVSVGR